MKSNVHSVVVSLQRYFSANEIEIMGTNATSDYLINQVASEKSFDTPLYTEIITSDGGYSPSVNIEGLVNVPLPKIDRCVPLEKRRDELEKSHILSPLRSARVLLSTSFDYSDFRDFMDPKYEDWDEDEPHTFFDWIEYCISDTSETLYGSFGEIADWKPHLTILCHKKF